MVSDIQFAGYYHHNAGFGLNLDLTARRAYSPTLGRFINRDPIRESAGINLYGYVRNNPISAIDPEGTSALGQVSPSISDIISAIVRFLSEVAQNNDGEDAGKDEGNGKDNDDDDDDDGDGCPGPNGGDDDGNGGGDDGGDDSDNKDPKTTVRKPVDTNPAAASKKKSKPTKKPRFAKATAAQRRKAKLENPAYYSTLNEMTNGKKPRAINLSELNEIWYGPGGPGQNED